MQSKNYVVWLQDSKARLQTRDALSHPGGDYEDEELRTQAEIYTTARASSRHAQEYQSGAPLEHAQPGVAVPRIGQVQDLSLWHRALGLMARVGAGMSFISATGRPVALPEDEFESPRGSPRSTASFNSARSQDRSMRTAGSFRTSKSAQVRYQVLVAAASV